MSKPAIRSSLVMPTRSCPILQCTNALYQQAATATEQAVHNTAQLTARPQHVSIVQHQTAIAAQQSEGSIADLTGSLSQKQAICCRPKSQQLKQNQSQAVEPERHPAAAAAAAECTTATSLCSSGCTGTAVTLNSRSQQLKQPWRQCSSIKHNA